MSQEPDREQPEEDRREDAAQEPPPSWPATPPPAAPSYPYPPQPWGAPDPDRSGTFDTADQPGEATREWAAPAPWPAPSDSGTSSPAGGTPQGSTAYGTGGYPPAPPGVPPQPPGSGYGAPPGYGAGTGYGPPGYGQPAYGGPGGYPPPAGYGQGHAGGSGGVLSPEQSSARTQGIVSLVLNLISVLACCNIFGIVGAILAGLALGRVDTDLPHARNLIKWSWVLLGGGLILIAVGLAVWLGIAFTAGTTGGF